MKRRPPYLLIALLAACGQEEKPRLRERENVPVRAEPTGLAGEMDPERRPALPFTLDQLRFHIGHNELLASAGSRHAVVPVHSWRSPSVHRATKVLGFQIREGHSRHVVVRYLDELGCDPDQEHETVVDLRPVAADMLRNEALDAYDAGRYEPAAQGFAAALEQVYSTETAIDRARALHRLGRTSEAAASLVPPSRDKPVLVYSKVATQPDLAALLQQPEIAALRASVPGTVSAAEIEAGLPLVGLDARWIAVPIRQAAWSGSDRRLELAIFPSYPRKAETLRIPLIESIDTDHEGNVLPARRAAVDAQLARTVSWLRDLGFGVDPKATAMELSALPPNGRLRRSPLRVKLARWKWDDRDMSRYDVWKNERVVGDFGQNANMTSCMLTYSPLARALIAVWTTSAPEGCSEAHSTFADIVSTP